MLFREGAPCDTRTEKQSLIYLHNFPPLPCCITSSFFTGSPFPSLFSVSAEYFSGERPCHPGIKKKSSVISSFLFFPFTSFLLLVFLIFFPSSLSVSYCFRTERKCETHVGRMHVILSNFFPSALVYFIFTIFITCFPYFSLFLSLSWF